MAYGSGTVNWLCFKCGEHKKRVIGFNGTYYKLLCGCGAIYEVSFKDIL